MSIVMKYHTCLKRFIIIDICEYQTWFNLSWRFVNSKRQSKYTWSSMDSLSIIDWCLFDAKYFRAEEVQFTYQIRNMWAYAMGGFRTYFACDITVPYPEHLPDWILYWNKSADFMVQMWELKLLSPNIITILYSLFQSPLAVDLVVSWWSKINSWSNIQLERTSRLYMNCEMTNVCTLFNWFCQ